MVPPVSSTRRRVSRQVALEQMASQERLDVLNDVTAPRHWIAGTVMGCLVLAALLWGIFGSVPVKVNGEGMLLRRGELSEVSAQVPGTIERVLVQQGDVVAPDQVVAILSQAEARRTMEQKCGELKMAKPEAELIIGSLNRHLAGLREREAKVARLVQQKLKPRSELLGIQREITTANEQIQLQQMRIRTLEQECDLYKGRVKRDSGIPAAERGKVVEVLVRPGDTVAQGAKIANLEPVEGPVKATVFVPAKDGKKVLKGLDARVAPSHVRPEEDGYILSRVDSISAFPVTPESLRKVLRNNQIVERLTQQGPLYKVVLHLEAAPGSPSGFQWTSGRGPDFAVETGTLCRASVIVERKCPLSFVIPSLRCPR